MTSLTYKKKKIEKTSEKDVKGSPVLFQLVVCRPANKNRKKKTKLKFDDEFRCLVVVKSYKLRWAKKNNKSNKLTS